MKVTDHKFVMKSFEKGTFCEHCELLFKGLYYQGYKCTSCSVSVHKNCIALVRTCGAPSLPPKSTNHSPSTLSFKKQFSLDKSFRLKLESRGSLRNSNKKPIEEYDWYAHTMTREIAERILMQLVNGVFLVRISSKQQGIYAISIKDNQQVKHMRILENDKNKFYLSQSKYFDDIIDLVNYYSRHSLGDSFFGLTITLKIPYKRFLKLNVNNENSKLFDNDSLTKQALSYCRASYDFSAVYPALSFQKGDLIEIIDKKGESKGIKLYTLTV